MKSLLEWIIACILLFHSFSPSDHLSSDIPRASDPLTYGVPSFTSIAIGIPAEEEVKIDKVGLPLTEEEFQTEVMVVDPPMTTQSSLDPIETQPGLFEGDLYFRTIDDFLQVTSKNTNANPLLRNAVDKPAKLWSSGLIPYEISSRFDTIERGSIALAMKQFQDITCVKFKEKINETDYVYLLKGDGCASSVGRAGGMQVMSLGKKCMTKGVILHEMMHVLGFYHEQSRPDRDMFITIVWGNIKSGLEHNFLKYTWDTLTDNASFYDLGSIMHYSSNAFAVSKEKMTIIPNNGEHIGQRYGLSKGDIQKVRDLYRCPNDGDCIDKKTACPGIASKKDCRSKNPWMRDNCCKSCKKYTKKGVKRPHAVQDEQIPAKSCRTWAKRGECLVNSQFMLKYCLKECEQFSLLSVPKDECKDKHPKCKEWSESKECVNNPNYMNLYCPVSCKICTPPKEKTDPSS